MYLRLSRRRRHRRHHRHRHRRRRRHHCCIPKAMVGWERRMRSTLTEREGLSALEHLRIEI